MRMGEFTPSSDQSPSPQRTPISRRDTDRIGWVAGVEDAIVIAVATVQFTHRAVDGSTPQSAGRFDQSRLGKCQRLGPSPQSSPFTQWLLPKGGSVMSRTRRRKWPPAAQLDSPSSKLAEVVVLWIVASRPAADSAALIKCLCKIMTDQDRRHPWRSNNKFTSTATAFLVPRVGHRHLQGTTHQKYASAPHRCTDGPHGQ